jgi:hypothetical protein
MNAALLFSAVMIFCAFFAWVTSPVAGVNWHPSKAPALAQDGSNLALACPVVLGLKGRVTGLAHFGREFLVSTRSPHALWVVAPEGAARAIKKLTSAPTALAMLGPDAAIVGLEGKGVFRLSVSTGKMEALRSKGGEAILQTSALAVAANGSFAVAEGSRRFGNGWPYDFLDGRPNGRVFLGRSDSNEVEPLPGNFYYSSGLGFDPNGQALLVAETFRYRIRRFARKTNGNYVETAPMASNLSMMPYSIENVDGYWYISGSLRNSSLETIQGSSVLLRIVAQLPSQMLKSLPTQKETRHAVIARLSPSGMQMRFSDFGGSIYGVSVFKFGRDRLAFGSFYQEGLRFANIRNGQITQDCGR